MTQPTSRLAVAALLLFVLGVPRSAVAQSETRPADRELVSRRLELGPVTGFTTAWHPAPRATAMPLGTALTFRLRVARAATVEWMGAREVERGRAHSMARVLPARPGTHRVAVRWQDDGVEHEETVDVDVRRLPVGGLDLAPPSLKVDALDVAAVPTRAEQLRYFFRPDSIAGLTELAPGHFRTSIGRWIALSAAAEPAAFASLVEWSVDGVPQRFLGSPLDLVVYPARSFEIEARLGAVRRTVRLDTYRAVITSHPRRTRIAEGEAVIFTAVTDPPGFEDEITWLASTLHGSAAPAWGHGPTFTTFFAGTFGENKRWLGVRADAATVSTDDAGAGQQAVDGEPLLLDVRATKVCGSDTSHELDVLWSVLQPAGPKAVAVSVLLDDGTELRSAGAAAGAARFALQAPSGGRAWVVLDLADGLPEGDGAAGPVERSAEVVSVLAPCIVAPQPAPGAGFEPGDAVAGGTGDGALREVDAGSLGSFVDDPAAAVVTVAGSGAASRLSTWRVERGEVTPWWQGEPLAGHDVRVHALDAATPLAPAADGPDPFLLAGRRDDGNLWLSLYTLAADGGAVLHDSVGYGANAGVRVARYAVAHRPRFGDDGRPDGHVVVTPVLTEDGSLRTVTWTVDLDDLSLRGRQDGGDWGQPGPRTPLGVIPYGDRDFVVAYRNGDDVLTTGFWDVRNDGSLDDLGGAASGRVLGGSGLVRERISGFALAPMEGEGYVSALLGAERGGLDMAVWEASEDLLVCDGDCGFEPRLLSDDTVDRAPGFGVNPGPPPTLTNDRDDDDNEVEVRGQLTDALWEELAGEDAGRLFRRLPPGEKAAVGIASVTKVMTLYLTLRAVENGTLDFGDLVVVSERAASIPGSSMNLRPFEIQSLENLLFGMMLPSGNDAAYAVAEHYLFPLGFPPFLTLPLSPFTTLMNTTADHLGMEMTKYGDPAFRGNSTPQDQITLFLAGRSVPRFLELLNTRSADALGESADSFHPLWKGDSGYPGLLAWKGGSRGKKVAGSEDVPLCTPGGCLLAAARRANRVMVVALQQSGSRFGDSNRLFDYGFRRLFTPDRRGDDKGQGGAATEIALAALNGEEAVTAVVTPAGGVELCNWLVIPGDGTLDRQGCATRSVGGLAPGSDLDTTGVEVELLTTQNASGDYLRATLQGGTLRLDAWRVAPKLPSNPPVQ